MKKKNFNGTIILFVRVALNMTGLTIPDKIQRARNIVTQMTGNPTFVTPDPALADVTTAIDKLETAYEDALDGGKTKKQQMYAHEKTLDDMLVELSGYVQTASNGDDLKILSTGMDVKKKSTPVGPLATPEDMKARPGVVDGDLDFAWTKVPNATGYIFEYTEDPLGTTPWIKVEGLTKAKITISGLVSAKKYWGRVAAIGTAGITNFSDPAVGRAL